MEALAAIGAASSIVQLIDFAMKVITAGKEIQSSVHGLSVKNQQLETVYRSMHTILETVDSFDNTSPSRTGLQSLSLHARKDCEDILGFLVKLKNRDGGHRQFGSMVVAFKSLIGQKKIEEMERRLSRAQSAISIQLSTTVCKEIRELRDHIADLTKVSDQYRIDSRADITKLSGSLGALQIKSDEIDARARSSPSVSGLDGQVQPVLPELVQKLDDDLNSAISTKKAVAAAQNVIASLHFDTLPTRHEAIPLTYPGTFHRFYAIPSFQAWLESGNGIFWLSGKPGSGKSTLMKFLADNNETEKLLSNWARPHKPTIAAHYFWYLGTNMQKSSLGLLRTIVFDILRKTPSSVQSLCQSRWQEASEYSLSGAQKSWTLEELSGIVEEISRNGERYGIRLCIFVDGLDEFDGDHIAACRLLASLASSPCVKICVSSRPWNVFVDEFGSEKLINMHEKTGPDIERLVRERVFSHSVWERNEKEISREEIQRLVGRIRERANGVFLWVDLVTKSLCDGLTNRDTIHDLERRLQLLPTDLNELFRLILDRIDSAYSEKSVECLLIALHSVEPLSPESYSYLESDHEDEEFAFSCTHETSVEHESTNSQERYARRIMALTGGLLEVHVSKAKKDTTKQAHVKSRAYVDFLHRTVAEFLQTEDINNPLWEKVRANFDVHQALAKINLVLLSCGIRRKGKFYWGDNRWETILDHLFFHYLPPLNSKPQHFEFVDRLLAAVERVVGRLRNNIAVVRFKLLNSNLLGLISRTLSTDNTYFSTLNRPPLGHLLYGPSPRIDLIKVLQNHGACDVNELYGDKFRSRWAQYVMNAWPGQVDDYFPAFQELISTAGADPNAVVRFQTGKSAVQTIFSLLLYLSVSPRISNMNLDGYLQTLGTFMDHGADFGCRVSVHLSCSLPTTISPGKHMGDCDKSGQATVAEVFCGQLRWFASAYSKTLMEFDGMMRAAFETTKLIVSKRGGSEAALVAQLRELIPVVFPEHMANELLRKLPPLPGVSNLLQIGRTTVGKGEQEIQKHVAEFPDQLGAIRSQGVGKGKRVSEANQCEPAGNGNRVKRRRAIEVIVLSSDSEEG